MSHRRAAAGFLAASALFVGGWALVAPGSFYASFPWPGWDWVSALGAYSEHLTRDVGGLYLALLVISVWAVLRPTDESFRVVGLAWSAFSIPHLVFHLDHLDVFGTAARVGNVVTLGGTAVLAALLVLPSRDAREA